MESLNGRVEQRLTTLEEDVRALRSRSHDQSNKLVEHGVNLDNTREDIHDLREEMNARFDKVGTNLWKAAMFVVTALGVAVAFLR